MQQENIKYYQDRFRRWLFNAALILSIFSIAGINLQVHSAVSESFRTELVESRAPQAGYRLNEYSKKSCKSFQTSRLSTFIPFNIWDILNKSNVVRIQFRSYRDRVVQKGPAVLKTLFKIPLSSIEDELPLFHLS